MASYSGAGTGKPNNHFEDLTIRTNMSILGVKVGTQRALCLLGEKGILTLRGNDATLGFLGSAYQRAYRKRDS